MVVFRVLVWLDGIVSKTRIFKGGYGKWKTVLDANVNMVYLFR